MPSVTLRVPGVLRPVLDGRDRLEVEGRTLPEALESAFAQVPVLRHHLMLENGDLRPHVLLLVNDVSINRREIARTTLADGDVVRVFQAISGG